MLGIRTVSVVSAVVAALAIMAACPLGAAVDGAWRLRINGFAVEPNEGIYQPMLDGTRVQVAGGAGAGGGINAEYRFSPRLGFELGLIGGVGSDLHVAVFPSAGNSVVLTDSLAFGTVVGGLNVHLTPERKADLYAGPTLAYVEYQDVTVRVLGFGPPFGNNTVQPVRVRFRFDSDLAVGVNLGVDVPLGEGGWLFNANARYLETSIGSADFRGGDRSYDPLFFGVGFGYRF
jgi:outer membrane protein W